MFRNIEIDVVNVIDLMMSERDAGRSSAWIFAVPLARSSPLLHAK
jgi:hypothetical protein